MADDRVSAELAAIRDEGYLEGPVPRLLAAVEAVLRVHHPVTETMPALTIPGTTTWTYCAHCGLKPGGAGASWPCPTVAAIEHALTGEDSTDASK